MYRSKDSVPDDGQWLWIYGVLLPMCQEPTGDDAYDWHRARWIAPVKTDAGHPVDGYWEFGFEELWVRNPLAWMAPPSAPEPSRLLDEIATRGRGCQSPAHRSRSRRTA